MKKVYTKAEFIVKEFNSDVITMSIGNFTDNLEGDIF